MNGQAVNNLQDLVTAVQASKGQYLQFDLEYNQVGARVLPGCTALCLLPATQASWHAVVACCWPRASARGAAGSPSIPHSC